MADKAAVDALDPQTFGNPETAPYWKASANGKLLLKRCTACARHHWYPRSHCPHCGATETAWVESAGLGRIYSFTVLRRAGNRVVSYVELDEGVSLFSNIVDCDPDSVEIGQRVVVRFRKEEDGTSSAVFAPASD